MHHINPSKAGVALGLLLGGFHLVWSVLVALGWAQAIYDFILWAHMVHLSFTVGPFDMSATVTLVIMTTVVGYVLGYCFALVWNRVHRGA